MSWPVKTLKIEDKIPEVRWRKWFVSFLSVLLALIVVWWVMNILSIVDSDDLLKLFTMLFLSLSFSFAIIFSIRIYYYGLCVSALDARAHEATLTRKYWEDWASQKLHIASYKLFLPSAISQTDIALSNITEIYNEQSLKLTGHNDETFTEEQLIYDLLSSVRSSLIGLSETCIFDVVFNYENNYVTPSIFKDCWAAIGLPVDCLGNDYYWNYELGREFDTLSNKSEERVSIIISANIESMQGFQSNSTEFASILLVTHEGKIKNKKDKSVALRTMTCKKEQIKKELINLITYQSDVLRTSKVIFSNMNINEVLDVSLVLKDACVTKGIEWEYETQHLDLMLGKLADIHLWLAFPLAVLISEKNNNPVLMVACVGNDYVFNVIKPFNDSKGQ